MGFKDNKKLILLVCVECVFILIHIVLENGSDSANVVTWHFLLPLVCGLGIIGYALSIRCNACGAGQVIRGFSAFDIRLRGKRCWRCGVAFEH